MPDMSDSDSDSSIPDYMLFGSGSFESSNTEYGELTECSRQQDEISRSDRHCSVGVQEISYTDINKQPHQGPIFRTRNSSGPCYVKTHDKNEVQTFPVRRVESDSKICKRSCQNHGSSSFQNKYFIRKNEALDMDSMHIKRRKCDLASEVTKAQEGQFVIKGDNFTDATLAFNLRTQKYVNSDKSVKHTLSEENEETNKLTSDSPEELSQTWEEIADCQSGQTRETLQSSQGESLNIIYRPLATHERANEGESLSSHDYHTCHFDLQNGDKFMTNNGFETCIDYSYSLAEESCKEKVAPGVMKASNDNSHITSKRKDESIFADSHHNHNLLKLQDSEDNNLKAKSTEVTNSAKSRDMLLNSTLDTASFDKDDLEQDMENAVADVVFDVSEDFNPCDKAMTGVMNKEDTGSEDAVKAVNKGRTNKELKSLDLPRDDQNPREMRSIFVLDKTNERLEVSPLEFIANTTNGLYSDQSTRPDSLTENTESASYEYTETQVKELSDDFELCMINKDYVQQLNRHENQLNETSPDPRGQQVSTDPESLAHLKALHPNIPGVSVIYRLRDDIRNIRMEDSHSDQHPRSDNEYVPEHGVHVYASESQRAVPGQPVQLQEINYNYPQYEHRYTSENYILPSVPHYGIHFPQGANRLLVRDIERSMEDPSESNAEALRNGRSEESKIYELENEFRDVKVDYNTRHKETEFPVYHNELSLSDCDMFGGPGEGSFSHPHALEGMSSTLHQHSLKNSPTFSQNEERRDIVPSAEVTLPVLTANSFWSPQSIKETSESLDADSSYCNQENHISGEMSVPVQEALNRSLSYESLHGVQERPLVFNRQTSCPSTESETNSVSFDVGLQRDFEFALELQQQLNHEIFMEDEAFAIYLDNNQRQTLSPPQHGSGRTQFFGPQAEEMISLNPQRRQRRPQHSYRHPGRYRRESAANRDGQRSRDQNIEGIISLHENNRGHTHHSHGNSQGNPQGVMQHRGAVAGANVADSRIPFDSDIQSGRESSETERIRDRPVPHWFEQGPVERVERIPGQSAQIDPSIITPLTRNYQEERRRREEQRRQLETREWEHEYSYQQQNWRGGHDLLPNEDYPSLDVHHSYYDPDEVFQLEDGDQYASITQDAFVLRRLLMTRRPNFEMPHNLENYDELWNLVEMLGDVRQQGLSQTHINMLPVHTFCEVNSGESRECNICLNAYSDGDEIRTLTCLHMFHTACIDEWLNRNAACPVCRQRVEIDSSE